MNNFLFALATGLSTFFVVVVVLAFIFELRTHIKKVRRAILVVSFGAGALAFLTNLS